MTDVHNKSFFGQKVGMILNSSAKTDPFIFLKFIKKKANAEWEKPSKREGKAIKISIEELIIILNVLYRKIPGWTSVHSFKNEKTPISLKWNSQNNDLWIRVGDYSKNFKFPQIEFLKLLIDHIIKEKIKFATSNTMTRSESTKLVSKAEEDIDFFESDSYFGEEDTFNNDDNKADTFNNKESFSASTKSKNNKSKQLVKARVKKSTAKAVLLCFGNGKEVWFPKSTIHSDFDPSQNTYQQELLVDEWILEKNSVI